jgi:hypothetical protein
LELSARVYNINEGHNVEKVERSEALRGYVRFIGKVREYEGDLTKGRRPGEIPRDERRKVMKTAITKGVQWCISRDILKGFFERNGSEVINMLFDEWKLEDALVVEREEGREEGILVGLQRGRQEGRQEGILTGVQKGIRVGVQKGIQKGKRESMLAIARNLKLLGDSPDKIIQVTGLSLDDIARL